MPEPSHRIDLKQAIELTQRWRAKHPEPGQFNAGQFDKSAFDRLFDQPGAAGIRIYMGEKVDGQWTYVMVATDKNRQDMVGVHATGMYAEEGGDIEDQTLPCPDYCDPESPLSGPD